MSARRPWAAKKPGATVAASGIKKCRAGAQRDQRIHVGCAVPRGLPRPLVDGPARPDHSGERDEQHSVFERQHRNVEEPGNDFHRGAVHRAGMAVHAERHGEKHDDGAADERGNGLPFQPPLLLVAVFFGFGGGGQRDVITGFAHGIEERFKPRDLRLIDPRAPSASSN